MELAGASQAKRRRQQPTALVAVALGPHSERSKRAAHLAVGLVNLSVAIVPVSLPCTIFHLSQRISERPFIPLPIVGLVTSAQPNPSVHGP